MTKRSVVLFWGAVAAAVFFLGSAWTAAGRISGPHGAANAVVFGVAGMGLAATMLVAGRIAFIIGRAQRRARAPGGPQPAGEEYGSRRADGPKGSRP